MKAGEDDARGGRRRCWGRAKTPLWTAKTMLGAGEDDVSKGMKTTLGRPKVMLGASDDGE